LEVHGHTTYILKRRDSLFPWRLWAKVRACEPDVIFAGNFVTSYAVLLRMFRLIRVPIVNCWNEVLREASPWCDMPKWVQRIIRPVLRRVEIFQAVHSDVSITASRQNAMLGREHGADVRFMLNAYCGDTPNPTVPPVRLNSSKFKIAYLGDQSGWNRKNLGMLFDAVQGERCTLYMVGKINEATQAKAPSNVVFIGEVPAAEVGGVLAQTDLLINCTDQDACAKNGEYIMAEKPLLVYRGRGMQENVFDHLHNAYITDDVKAGLRLLMGFPHMRYRLGYAMGDLPVPTFDERADWMMGIVGRDWRGRHETKTR